MNLLVALVLTGLMMFFLGEKVMGGVLEDVMEGKASVIDMTYPLNEENPYWPVGTYMPFKYEVVANMKKDMVFSGRYNTPEHLGTHIDAPNHFALNQPSVDQIPFEQLVGPAVVIDVTEKADRDADYTLSPADVSAWENANGRIPDGSIVLLNTGWGNRWHNFDQYKNMDTAHFMHFPGFSKETATFFVEKRRIKGIGIDTLSGDCGTSSDFQVHHIINGAGKFILENVANLDKLPPKGATLLLSPIKIEGGSGGQCRIWAILPR